MKALQNPKILGFIIALICTVATMWFYLSQIHQSNQFVIDNPKDSVISIILDKKEYTLAPFQSLPITLNEGLHTISIKKNDSIYKPKKFKTDGQIRGLINPTLSDYYTYKQYYAINVNKDSLIKSHSTLIDSTRYFGEINHYNQVFVDDFYLNVNQEYLKVMKNMDTISGVVKIFRKENFIQYYNQNYK